MEDNSEECGIEQCFQTTSSDKNIVTLYKDTMDELVDTLEYSPSIFDATAQEVSNVSKLINKYSRIWLAIRIVILAIILSAAIFLSWWYNAENVDESVKTNTRYTWLTWLETLDRVSGLALGIAITLISKLIVSTATKWITKNDILDVSAAILKKSKKSE